MSRWHVDEKSIYDENGKQIIEGSEWYMRGDLQKICDEHNVMGEVLANIMSAFRPRTKGLTLDEEQKEALTKAAELYQKVTGKDTFPIIHNDFSEQDISSIDYVNKFCKESCNIEWDIDNPPECSCEASRFYHNTEMELNKTQTKENEIKLTELSRVDELSVRKIQVEALLNAAKEQLTDKVMLMLSQPLDKNHSNKAKGITVFLERWIEGIDKEIKSLQE